LLLTAQDENQQTTTFGYDFLNRLTSITRSDNVAITTSYDDNSARPAVTKTTPIETGKSVVQVRTSDGLGRTIKQETKDAGGASYSIVETQYDALGRVTQTSNPHAPSESAVWTTYSYDALSRPTTVTPPGNAGNNQYSYSGNATTTTDPAGKQRRTYTDALGRLVETDEPGYADGSPGRGSVAIGGAEQSVCDPDIPPPTCIRIYDSGYVSVTVNGFTATRFYDRNSTSTSIAAALAGPFNTSPASSVTATVSGSTINFVSKQMGAHTNYYTLSSQSDTYDPTHFGGASFGGTPSGPTLTGGADGTGADGSQPSISTPLITVSSYDPLDNLLAGC